jgi:hypothetical protein
LSGVFFFCAETFGLGIWLLSDDLERTLALIFPVDRRYEGNI